MRKFLWGVAVGALILAMATPAVAAVNFKFGSEYRVRFYSGVNVGFDDTAAGNSPRGAQLRIRPRFDASDDNGNITAVLRLEVGDIEFGLGGGPSGETNGISASPGGTRVGPGQGGSIGADGVNVETKWAYIDAAAPFGLPLRVRAGLQPWFLPKGIIVDDDVAGVRAYGSVKPVSYEVSWYRLARDNAFPAAANPTTRDNSFDVWGARFDLAFAPILNVGVYGLYGLNKAGQASAVSAENWWIGVTTNGKFGIVSYDLDFVYGSSEGSPSVRAGATGQALVAGQYRDVRGFVVDGGVHLPVGPITLNLVASVASGDDRQGGDSDAFPSIAASWNGPGGLFNIIGSGGPFDAVEFTQDSPVNLWTVGGTIDYRPVKQMLLSTGVAFAGFYSSSGNCVNKDTGAALPNSTCFGPRYPVLRNKNYLGTEFFLRADYDIWTGFKVQGQAGWLVPSTGDTAHEYVLQLYYNF